MVLPLLPLPLHGTLIQLEELGVYLIGCSGSGKSETALQLVHNGARLVCDDAPQIQNEVSGIVTAHCPAGFEGQIHIRNLGIINIIDLFGSQAVIKSQTIDFIVEIATSEDYHPTNSQIQYLQWQHQSLLIDGQRIYRYQGRNMALLVHTAVLQYKQSKKHHGYSI